MTDTTRENLSNGIVHFDPRTPINEVVSMAQLDKWRSNILHRLAVMRSIDESIYQMLEDMNKAHAEYRPEAEGLIQFRYEVKRKELTGK